MYDSVKPSAQVRWAGSIARPVFLQVAHKGLIKAHQAETTRMHARAHIARDCTTCVPYSMQLSAVLASTVSAVCKKPRSLSNSMLRWVMSQSSCWIYRIPSSWKEAIAVSFSIESPLPSKEGVGDHQMTPKLFNEVFSAKSYNVYNSDIRNLITLLETYKQGT